MILVLILILAGTMRTSKGKRTSYSLACICISGEHGEVREGLRGLQGAEGRARTRKLRVMGTTGSKSGAIWHWHTTQRPSTPDMYIGWKARK